ncbi:MAG TPA: universal stress protein [Solirubrobacterales bacterium]|nr:universal stress protein [Solirubrobacterales bacterium]
MSDLVVGYDASECSKLALREACGLARQLGDRIVVVFGYAPGGYGGGEFPQHREAVEEIGEKITAEAAERAERAGVEHEVVLLPLKAEQALIQVANERDARMIVVGSYGEPPLRGVILGSTPNKLLHLAERPVLVVPVGDQPDAAQ